MSRSPSTTCDCTGLRCEQPVAWVGRSGGTVRRVCTDHKSYVDAGMQVISQPPFAWVPSQCDQRPEIAVHARMREGQFSQTYLDTVRAMADAFSCSLPTGHEGDHTARDADGEPLCWWEQ